MSYELYPSTFSSNTLATTGNSAIVTAPFTYSLSSFLFNGAGASVDASVNTAYDYTTTFLFTWAFSINYSVCASPVIMSKRSGNVGWHFQIVSNSIRIRTATDASNVYILQSPNNSVTAGVNTRIMGVISSVKAENKIFINGVNQTLTDTSLGTLGSITNAGIFSIGSINSASTFYLGGIDEVRFWTGDQSSLSALDYNNGRIGNPNDLSPEHMYQAEGNANDSGTGTPINLTLVTGATYGAGIS